jgi:Na+/proline symporter
MLAALSLLDFCPNFVEKTCPHFAAVCLQIKRPLLISFGIGVYHALKSSKNNEEFVMGSRSLGVIPMAISLCASFNSAYMILGIPGEIYSYGTQFYIMILGTGFGVLVAAELWLPILYRIQVVSIYEYFELRYKSKFPRILMTLIFILKVNFKIP